MTSRIPMLLALPLALVALGGCGEDEKAPATAKPVATAAAAPYGIYSRRVTKADIARTASARSEYGPGQQLPPTGRYQLVFAKGAGQDVLKVTDPDEFTVDMDVTFEAGRLRATAYVDPARASFCGPEIPAGAVYAFRSTGTTLRLMPKTDQCADRDMLLTGEWTKG